jgi:hypothetical protein
MRVRDAEEVWIKRFHDQLKGKTDRVRERRKAKAALRTGSSSWRPLGSLTIAVGGIIPLILWLRPGNLPA